MTEMTEREMGNPQVTQTELAWLAGIWDGEGHFSIRRAVQSNGNNRPQYNPKLGVTNTNTQILSEVRRILSALDIPHYFREKGTGGFPGSTKQCWLIDVGTFTSAYKLIQHIRPYLVGKRFQADCILEYCERRMEQIRKKGPNKTRAYAERDFELVSLVYEANGDIRGTSETVRQDAQRAMIQSDPTGNRGTWNENSMRHHQRGYHLSEEHKKKLSEAGKGRIISPGTRQKMSEAKKSCWRDKKDDGQQVTG